MQIVFSWMILSQEVDFMDSIKNVLAIDFGFGFIANFIPIVQQSSFLYHRL
jgi:hypothetical protein